MKKINYLLGIGILMMFIGALMLFLVSCGKNGAVGPTGATGSTGATGAVGPAGPAGANGQNGSVIYSGTTLPATTIGVIGDFYINLSTGLLYGPKTATGWGTGFSLKGSTGATGATGTAGSKIYNGSVAPASTLGVNGDYYLDIANYMLYGPKTASGWGTPISLQGPQGPEGNANVKTDVFTVAGSDWLWNSQYVYETSAGGYTEYFTKYYVRSNNAVTQDLLNTGLVLVYFTPSPVNNPNQWAPLPYQFDSSFGYTFNYVYVTAVGSVTLMYFFIQTDATATVPTLSSYNDVTRQYKIVTIAGETGTFMLKHHINLNNYQEVSKVTGIWQQDKANQ